MLPAGQDAAEAFYRIIDAAYERRSIAVTSNIHPSGFDTIMPKTLATATVDRLLHHAHLVLTKGDSHRLAEALAGKGVSPWHLTPPAGRTRGHQPGKLVAASPEKARPPNRISQWPLTVGYATDRPYWCRWRSRQVPTPVEMPRVRPSRPDGPPRPRQPQASRRCKPRTHGPCKP